MPKSRFHGNEANASLWKNCLKDCGSRSSEQSSVSFSGLTGGQPKGWKPGPELYLDNCTENDFEQRPVGRGKKKTWQHEIRRPLKTEYWVLRETSVPLQFDLVRLGREGAGTDWSQDQATKKSSYKERRVDAKAPYADEGRGKLRKAAGNCKQVMIRRYPNGGTRPE